LLADGHQPVLFDLEHNPRRLEIVLSGEQISALPFVQGDVCTHDAVLNACKDQQIDGIINFILAKNTTHLWDDCVEFNRRLDVTRNQSFTDVTPEFKPYV
jgi:nucleoside-diphosphate-sugar epimerase